MAQDVVSVEGRGAAGGATGCESSGSVLHICSYIKGIWAGPRQPLMSMHGPPSRAQSVLMG